MANKSSNQVYRKRPGTSGIRGQLYETKLLSLIYFRVLHDYDIEEFYLATNVDEIGVFDDICLRAKLKGFDKPINMFIQAKHRENDKLFTLTSKKDLADCFDSYLKIKRRFQPSNEDALFKGTFCETDCVFVIYTTAKYNGSRIIYTDRLAKYRNNLIGTGHVGSQPLFPEKYMDLLYQQVLEEQLITLAQKIAKYMLDDAKSQIMDDELVLKYHYILAQKVFDISEIQPDGLRTAGFREDFFCQSQKIVQIIKDTLCSEILERRKINIKNETQGLLTQFISQSDNIQILSQLIRGSVILFKNGNLEFRDKMVPQYYKEQLDRINLSKKRVREKAVELAVRGCKSSLEFKVPVAFGNKDLAIRGSDVKIDKRLDYLCKKLIPLMENPKPNNIVILDESLEDGFLRLNGGIASAVGNILVFDYESKLLKFCKNCESLGNIAKRFFTKLQIKIKNIHDYRFVTRGKMFPKLWLDLSEDEHIVKDFFKKLVIYASQGDEHDVEDILKGEIQSFQARHHNAEIRSEAIFLKYHDGVQKWWMVPKEGSYLTKESELYKNAVDSTSQSLMGIINMMHTTKYKEYSFNDDAVNSLNLEDQPSGTVIITDISALTVAKLLIYMKNKDFVVLDLEYIVKLSERDYNTFHDELTNANAGKTLIIVVDKILKLTTNTSKRLEKIALTLKDKTCFFVAVQSSFEFVKMYFSLNNNVIMNEKNNLTDLDEELQKNILENTKIIFQDEEVSLGDVLDNVTITNVGGEVLYQILYRDRNILGKSIVNSSFNITECVVTMLAPVTAEVSDIGKAFCEPQNGRNFTRRVHKDKSVKFIELDSLRELTGDVTVIVANPGMGKTTFLSQLSTVIKQNHPTVWILRINLLEYAAVFSGWQENKTVIDTLESLKFMCQVALSEDRSRTNDVKITLEEADGVVLQDCTGDEWTVFELKIFLHCYNTGKVLFLFDGFDEICPHYAYEVLKLTEVLKNHPLKHKIYITSRSYEKIVTILELQFGKLYEIVPWSHAESFCYLNMIWDRKRILKDLKSDQLKSVHEFITFMAKKYNKGIAKKRNDLHIQAKEIPFSTIYFWFIKYLKANLTSVPSFVMRSLNKLCEDYDDRSENTDEFFASPLLLNLISDYLYKKIRDSYEIRNKWYIDTNIFKVYKSVLNAKLQRIRFEERNQINMYIPDNIIAFNKEYANFVATHKKLAAYAIFQKHHDQLFDINDLREINNFINMLKEGEEKSGIICNVVNDIPIFVHSTFAEYFAVEFICDLLKSSSCKQRSMTNIENKRKIWHFILNVMFFECNLDVLATLDAKIEIDEEFTRINKEENKRAIFELLLEQSKNAKIKSSLCETIRYDLRNLGKLLLSTTENNLNKNNLMDFIKILTETNLLMNAIKMEFEEIIVTIIEHVRVIDKSKLNMLFANYGLNKNIDDVGADEIIHELHKHVWTRMDIVPDWNNLAELSGQIYFI